MTPAAFIHKWGMNETRSAEKRKAIEADLRECAKEYMRQVFLFNGLEPPDSLIATYERIPKGADRW